MNDKALDAVVDELMRLADEFAQEHYLMDGLPRGVGTEPPSAPYRAALESAIRTALLNGAREAFKEGFAIGTTLGPSAKYFGPDADDFEKAWLNSKTRATLEGK